MTDNPTTTPTHGARWKAPVPKPEKTDTPAVDSTTGNVPATFTSTGTPRQSDSTTGGVDSASVSAGGIVLWGLVASVALAVWFYRKHPGKFGEHREELKTWRKKSDKKQRKAEKKAKRAAEKAAAESGIPPEPQVPPVPQAPVVSGRYAPGAHADALTAHYTGQQPQSPPWTPSPPTQVWPTPQPDPVPAPEPSPVTLDMRVPGGNVVPVQIPPTSPAYSMVKEDENRGAEPVENLLAPVENVQPVQEELDLSVPSELEAQIMGRLDRKAWGIAARERGLSDTAIEEVSLTKEGIVARIKLNGKGGLDELRDREESVRAILQTPDDLLTDIDNSGVAGWALLTVRTRLACAEFIRWTPDGPLGTCTATGEPVQFNWRRRLLVAGESGAGKSTTIRPWLAEIIKSKEAALIYIDTKMVEGALWRGHARVALTVEEVYYCMEEAEQELDRRLRIMVAHGLDKWIPTEQDPTLVFVVDEGADHVRESRKREKTDLGADLDGRPIEVVLGKAILSWMEKITTMGRAAEMHMWWLTQYPTKSDGCPPQIAENMTSRISMVLASRSAADVVFGAENVKAGWAPHRLPQIVVGSTKGLGRALVRMDGHKPRPVQVHYMDKSEIKKLPASLIWSVHGSKMSSPPASVIQGEVVEKCDLSVENLEPPVSRRLDHVPVQATGAHESLESGDDVWGDVAPHADFEGDKKEGLLRIMHEHGGEMQAKELEELVPFSRATLDRYLGEMRADGLVENHRHGMWRPVSETE